MFVGISWPTKTHNDFHGGFHGVLFKILWQICRYLVSTGAMDTLVESKLSKLYWWFCVLWVNPMHTLLYSAN